MINTETANNRLRVAVYCRTATTDETISALMEQHYISLFQTKPEWELVGIYADYGVTGIGMEKRVNFQAMIADALSGKIDCIITKSITRFTRNTTDFLACIHKLNEHGIRVIFEKERLDTLALNNLFF